MAAREWVRWVSPIRLESYKLMNNFRPADNDRGGEGATEANLMKYNADLILPNSTTIK
jgi:hypothetical protein